MQRRTVVYFGIHNWDFMTQRPHYIALALARGGDDVYYVEPYFPQLHNKKGYSEKVENNLTLLRPYLSLILRANRIPGLSWLNNLLIYLSFLIHKRRLKIKPEIVILSNPSQHHFAKYIRDAVRVYDLMDDYTALRSLTNQQFVRNYVKTLEEQLIHEVDMVVFPSQGLLGQVATRYPSADQDKFVVMFNGIDLSEKVSPEEIQSQKEVDDLKKHYKKTLGFVGAIYQWLDVPLLHSVAKDNPEYLFLLIGPYLPELKKNFELPNLIFWGSVAHENVLSFIKSFDIGLLSYKVNETTKIADPVKFYEHLYMKKPSLAAKLDNILGKDGVCMYYNNKDEFEKCMRNDSFMFDEKEAAVLLKEHSWPRLIKILRNNLENLITSP